MRGPFGSSLSIVVATYEWPEALNAVLGALSEQSDSAFEVIVADDGSGPGTSAVVESWKGAFGSPVAHAWQPDDGYRRARILNLGARRATGDYLVFLDGDCIPRRRFVECVRRAALPGWFLAGKRVNLRPHLSRRILEHQVPVWRWSAARWLLTAPREVRRPGLLVPLRDRRRPWRAGQPDFVPPYFGYGYSLGVFRADFERVNGFDCRFTGWGEEDLEIVVRLSRSGLRCGWPGPGSTVLHLWHSTRTPSTRRNEPLLRETERSGRVEAIVGLRELASQVSAKRCSGSSVLPEPGSRRL